MYYCIAITLVYPDLVYPYPTLVLVRRKAVVPYVLPFSIRQGIGRTNCDLLRGATVLCAAPFLGLSKDVANSGYAQLEEALWVWFGNIRSRRLTISDEMFRVKAKEFGETMGISGLFTACNTVLSINIHATIQIEDTFLSDI